MFVDVFLYYEVKFAKFSFVGLFRRRNSQSVQEPVKEVVTVGEKPSEVTLLVIQLEHGVQVLGQWDCAALESQPPVRPQKAPKVGEQLPRPPGLPVEQSPHFGQRAS